MQLEQFFNVIGTKITKNTIVKKSSRQTLFTADDMSDKVSYKKKRHFSCTQVTHISVRKG